MALFSSLILSESPYSEDTILKDFMALQPITEDIMDLECDQRASDASILELFYAEVCFRTQTCVDPAR